MKKRKSAKIYQTIFLSGELEFIRKPSHGQKIIVFPMYILAIAASATYMIPIQSGERICSSLNVFYLLEILQSILGQSNGLTQAIDYSKTNLSISDHKNDPNM